MYPILKLVTSAVFVLFASLPAAAGVNDGGAGVHRIEVPLENIGSYLGYVLFAALYLMRQLRPS